MKKYVYCMLFLCLLPNLSAAQEIDLLSDEILLGDTSQKDEVDVNLPVDEEEDEVAAEEGKMFGFIKPIIEFFASDESDDEKSKDGISDASTVKKKETYLEKNIRLAEGGSLEHQMNLGYIYLYGTNGVKPDFEKSFKYYSMAAQQNDAIATNNLGSLYFNGIGTDRDVKMALKLFERAAELGNDDAAVNLAFIYLTGGKKDAFRNKKAVKLLQSASKENKIAQFMLGYAYYKGFVVPQNFAEAFKLIKSAAGEGAQIDEAQIVLAQMYIDGHGTVQNYQSAIAAYRAAVQQGNLEACQMLADIYREGKIVLMNPVLAHAIYNIAASRGDVEAMEKRDKLGKVMELEQLLQAQENAREFKSSPSELTSYIRQTYGDNIRHYIDLNIE